ncbi:MULTISPECIES: ChbG/HpnK family deacetylase [unclassified Variovorax]|uniref:ChbG/HpnK family deacetylase n=1 Tax=unclassified Variovorax TaxID=663243 RepID=UPI003ECF3F0E
MTEHAPRYLCICADDFGMTEGINSAVLELAGRHKISAISCMVRRDAWAVGLRGLRGIEPSCTEVGLHLDLSPPPEGRQSEPGLGGLIVRSHLRLLRPSAVRAEIRDQLARFEDGLGRRPAFVDGHRHVHQLPVVSDVLTEEIARRYGTEAPWVRSTAPPAPRRLAKTKADIVFALGGARLLELAARRGIPTSRALLGIYDFTGTSDVYRGRLRQWIDCCRTGDVLVCHPSLGDAPWVPAGPARRNEYAVLSAIAFPMMTAAGVVFLRPLSHLSRAADPVHA